MRRNYTFRKSVKCRFVISRVETPSNRYVLGRVLLCCPQQPCCYKPVPRRAKAPRHNGCMVVGVAPRCYRAIRIYVLFKDAGKTGRCTRPNFVARNIMEKSPKQEEVGAHGAPNLRQIQVRAQSFHWHIYTTPNGKGLCYSRWIAYCCKLHSYPAVVPHP